MDEFRVDLAAFQGPLDLLLYLVQQEEVDVYEIPIAKIADRFLDLCRNQAHTLDVDKAGEFLVMASQLLVIKSRALLPRETPLDVEEIDPRLDLVRQLLEYRDFKNLAASLDERGRLQIEKHPVRVTGPDRKRVFAEDEPHEADLFLLVEAFQRLMRETGDDHTFHTPKERLPITHFVGQIFDHLISVGGVVGFRELLGARPDRSYVIGAFLALLELMKLRKVRVQQGAHGEIEIRLVDVTSPAAAGGASAFIDGLDNPDLHEEAHTGPRIVFMGSPGFAVPALRSLIGAGFRPRLVVTPPPKRAGRGRRLLQVPVAREAESQEIPLHRTRDVNGRTSRAEIEAVRPDVIITAGFGQKLGTGVLSLAARGCINVHASLLPQLRGASPVAAAVREGLDESGVSLFVMDEELDRGPVIGQVRVPIGPDDTTDDLMAKLAEAGADLLVRTLGSYLDGELEPTPQDHEAATYVGRIAKDAGVVDWARPARDVRNHIRSVTAWPGAQAAWQPKVKHDPLPVVIGDTTVIATEDSPGLVAPDSAVTPSAPAGPATTTEVRPGTVLAVSTEGIDVACQPGILRVLTLKPMGGRLMAVKDFLNARRVVEGDRFVAPPVVRA